MAEANTHYYATRDPLGAAGDFTTAPEISQMFGELIGLWCADLWQRAGRPLVRYAELGPGRGTLAADALRAMRGAGLDPPVELVETSPVLRALQAQRLPAARWYDEVAALPEDRPLLIVANEFFDALPIQQHIGAARRERMVAYANGRFMPDPIGDEEVRESSPASVAIVATLAGRIAAQGGAALIFDYGAEEGGSDTLQAVSRHAFADPWSDPGSRDLTALVDFQALAEAARAEGVRIFGPREQGLWLEAMGIDLRAATLAKTSPERASEVESARDRLVQPAQMGRLFKAMAIVARSWPAPAGFA